MSRFCGQVSALKKADRLSCRPLDGGVVVLTGDGDFRDTEEAAPLYNTCNPQTAFGALMVSSEGACAAWYQYRQQESEA